jgi:hypothetical protein
MANGCAALPIALVPTSADKPGAATELELETGCAAAAAAAAIARAVLEFQRTGMLGPENKEAGGERIARVVQLCLEAPDGIRFAATVRRGGKRELSRRFGTDLTQDATIETVFAGLLEIVDHVVALERSLAH